MRITFIRPNMIEGKAKDAMEPLAFAILSKLTPSNIEKKFYDEKVEPILFEEETDLVAMTVDTFSARRAYQIASHYHHRNIPVVMGGPHPTLCSSEVLNFADAVVIGEADNVWPQIILDLKKNQLKRIYKGKHTSLANLQIDRDIFGKRKGNIQRGKRSALVNENKLNQFFGCYNFDWTISKLAFRTYNRAWP